MKSLLYRMIASAVLAFSAAAKVPAQIWEHATAADSAMVAYLEKLKTPNVSVAVARGGRLLYSKAWAWTLTAQSVDGGERWLFRLASVSKPITSNLTMELVQQGKFELDKPVREYLPDLPSSHTYTASDLLRHLSGVR